MVSEPPVREQARTCPACDASNGVDRELCGSCGVDLDSGAQLPHPVQRDVAPDPPVGREAPIEHARWVVPVLGTVIAVALSVAGLTAAGYGPLASGPDVPSVAFSPAIYDDEAGPLEVAAIATRTSAAGAPPSAMFDGEAETAWRSGGSLPPGGDGPGETVDVGLAGPAWIDRLVLRNGDHADADAYDTSARLSRVRLRFDGGEMVLADLLDQGLEAQELVLPDPVLTTEVRIDVLEAFPGRTDELAVSELELRGWAASGGDVEAAERRAEVEPASRPTSPGPATVD
jgi:hypothetical protein